MAKMNCKHCGSTKNLQRHHITPRSQGGENSFMNRIIVCKKCHASFHGQLLMGGLGIKSTRDGQLKNENKDRHRTMRISEIRRELGLQPF